MQQPSLCSAARTFGKSRLRSHDVNSYTTQRLARGGARIRRVEDCPTKTSFSSVRKFIWVLTCCRQFRDCCLKFQIFSKYKSGIVEKNLLLIYWENFVTILTFVLGKIDPRIREYFNSLCRRCAVAGCSSQLRCRLRVRFWTQCATKQMSVTVECAT